MMDFKNYLLPLEKYMSFSWKVAAIVIFVCPLFFGCFTNFYLNSPLEANQKRITDHAEIVLRSGLCFNAVEIKVGSDTTRFVISGTDSLRQIRTDEIDRLIVKNHVGGAIGGLFAGVPTGLGAGILLATWTGEFNKGSGNMTPLIYVASGIAAGGIGGAIYWGVRGYRDNYIFPSDSVSGF